MKKLDASFYNRNDVTEIARQLLGKLLITQIDGVQTSGRIVETEAYAGEVDRASHAYGGRRTNRTEVMFGRPGVAYVYLCYGIHHLFNVVTNRENVPHAVLVRALEPIDGLVDMLIRTKKAKADASLTRGPAMFPGQWAFIPHTAARICMVIGFILQMMDLSCRKKLL